METLMTVLKRFWRIYLTLKLIPYELNYGSPDILAHMVIKGSQYSIFNQMKFKLNFVFIWAKIK